MGVHRNFYMAELFHSESLDIGFQFSFMNDLCKFVLIL